MSLYIMAANWTTELPTVDGVYLARSRGYLAADFVRVFTEGLDEPVGATFGGAEIPLLKNTSYVAWCGPLIVLPGG